MDKHEDLRAKSKVILNDLGESFARAFSIDDQPDDVAINILLQALDNVNIPREVALDQSNARVSRLLNNPANTHFLNR